MRKEENNQSFRNSNIYPTTDDTKDSGNPGENSDVFITMFNPNDEKYGIKKYMGKDLRGICNNKEVLLYPNLRTLHIVQNRDGEAPKHFFTSMEGKTFKKLQI